MMKTSNKIVRLYIDGFRSMRLGKKLWLIVAIKLFILFAIVKVFFFPNIMQEKFHSDKERSRYIVDQLTKAIQHKGEE